MGLVLMVCFWMLKNLISVIITMSAICTSTIMAQHCNVSIDLLDNNQCRLSCDTKTDMLCDITQLPEKLSNVSDGSLTLSTAYVDNQNNNVVLNNLCGSNKTVNLVLQNKTNNTVNVLLNIGDELVDNSTITSKQFESLTVQCNSFKEITNLMRKKYNSTIIEQVLKGKMTLTPISSTKITGDYINFTLNN